MEDSKIISLFFERSEQAIEELDHKHGPAVKRTAANILKDRLDVEECVSDTYLRTWNSIPPQAPNPLASYVCRIAHNLAIDRYHANTAAKRNGNYDLVLDEIEECIPSGMTLRHDCRNGTGRERTRRFHQPFLKQSEQGGPLFICPALLVCGSRPGTGQHDKRQSQPDLRPSFPPP